MSEAGAKCIDKEPRNSPPWKSDRNLHIPYKWWLMTAEGIQVKDKWFNQYPGSPGCKNMTQDDIQDDETSANETVFAYQVCSDQKGMSEKNIVLG